MTPDQGYRLLAGKCKIICDAIVAVDPSWRLVRGHYFDPIWNQNRAHWWLVSADGVVYDPTREQFPSRGMNSAGYVEFDGNIACAQCGTVVTEEKAIIESNYGFCSDVCYGKFVGIY